MRGVLAGPAYTYPEPPLQPHAAAKLQPRTPDAAGSGAGAFGTPVIDQLLRGARR
jgi:hypothetical protein